MNTQIALGQRVSAGFQGTVLTDELKRTLADGRIGNIILFRRNIESFDQLYTLCTDLRVFIEAETGYAPFIMLDEECGSVSRLAHIAGCTPCAMAIGETGNPENAYAIGRQIGRQLSAVGINFNLAPVLDCFTHKEGIATGNRSFGEAPELVGKMGTAYIRGIHESGILTCSKHFPGGGSTKVDSHLALPIIDRTLAELESLELRPFRQAIAAGTDAIMTAHIMLPQIEKALLPSTLSKTIMTDLLRGTLGFDGILVSDSLEMHAVQDMYPFDQAMTMAFKAGVDIALICNNPGDARDALAAQIPLLDSGTLCVEDCERSANRIVRYKEQMAAPTGDRCAFMSDGYHDLAVSILQQVIRVTPARNGRCLHRPGADSAFLGVESYRASIAGDDTHYRAAEILAGHFGSMYWPEIPESVPDDCTGVYLVMEYDGKPENAAYTAFVDRLVEMQVPVTVFSMFTPTVLNAFPDTAVKVCAWQYDQLSVECLMSLLARQPL